jgi:hypothetical protein
LVAGRGADPAAFAGGFVATWADTGPGREIAGGWEPGHVGAGLGDDHVDREAIEPRNGEQRLVDRIERGRASVDLLGQRPDRLIKEVEVSEDPTTGHRVVRAEVPGQRFCERRDLRSHLALGQRGEFRWILFAGDQRFDHRPSRLQTSGSSRGGAG